MSSLEGISLASEIRSLQFYTKFEWKKADRVTCENLILDRGSRDISTNTSESAENCGMVIDTAQERGKRWEGWEHIDFAERSTSS